MTKINKNSVLLRRLYDDQAKHQQPKPVLVGPVRILFPDWSLYLEFQERYCIQVTFTNYKESSSGETTHS